MVLSLKDTKKEILLETYPQNKTITIFRSLSDKTNFAFYNISIPESSNPANRHQVPRNSCRKKMSECWTARSRKKDLNEYILSVYIINYAKISKFYLNLALSIKCNFKSQVQLSCVYRYF